MVAAASNSGEEAKSIRSWATAKHAGIGAGVALVTGLIPLVGFLSPVVGGGVAGWLSDATDRHGAKVGALTGVFLSLLGVPFLLAGVVFLGVSGPPMMGPTSMVAPVFALVAALFGLVYLVGLGTVGGYLGARYTDRDDGHDTAARTEDPIDQLKQQYADGDISDLEFERRLETLLDDDETEQTASQSRETQR